MFRHLRIYQICIAFLQSDEQMCKLWSKYGSIKECFYQGCLLSESLVNLNYRLSKLYKHALLVSRTAAQERPLRCGQQREKDKCVPFCHLSTTL